MVKVNMRDISIQVWPHDPASHWCLRCLYLSELLKVLDKCVCLWMCFKTSCRLLGGLRHCSIWAVHGRDRLSPSVWRLPATSKVLMWIHRSLKLAEVLSTSLSFLFFFNFCFSLFLSLLTCCAIWEQALAGLPHTQGSWKRKNKWEVVGRW